MSPDLIDAFWDRVIKGDGCWEWQGPRLPRGYGQFIRNRNRWYAHRFSYTVSHGDIPTGYVVMHVCDNPPCVRPDHLRVGTQAENREDCAAKGRNPLNGNQLKTHCKRGHEFTGRNFRFTGRGNQRVCRVCEADRLRRRRKP